MSDWLTGPAPMPKHACDYVECETPDIRYVVHETGAIWRCCFSCFQKARAVAKAKHAGLATHTWAEYCEAKGSWYDRKRHEWELSAIERERETAAKLAAQDDFFSSREWLRLRYQTLLRYGRRCMCCGTTAGIIQVDHIKPRSKRPDLALDPENLQVLCKDCNQGKSNIDSTDFRPDGPEAA